MCFQNISYPFSLCPHPAHYLHLPNAELTFSEIQSATTPQPPWHAMLRYNPYLRQIRGKHLFPTHAWPSRATVGLECGSLQRVGVVDHPLDLWGGDKGQRVLCHPVPQVPPSQAESLRRIKQNAPCCKMALWIIPTFQLHGVHAIKLTAVYVLPSF